MTGERYDVGTALRALASPLTVGALVVLVLNDHAFKEAWPSFVTGKLSDVTGLVVAPVLLAVVLAVLRVRRAATLALLVSGAGFAWVKTTYLGATLAGAVWSWLWGPSLVLRDPVDLLALPALGVAWLVMRRATSPSVGRRRAATITGALVLPFAVVATTATSCSGPGDTWGSVAVVKGPWEDLASGQERRFVLASHASVDRDGVLRALTAHELERMPELYDRRSAVCDPADVDVCWEVLGTTQYPDRPGDDGRRRHLDLRLRDGRGNPRAVPGGRRGDLR